VSPLRNSLADYLRVRRQLGAQLRTSERMLLQFVEFLEAQGAVRITSELAVEWAMLPTGARPDRWAVRLGMVRGFAKYLATIDPASEIPSVELLKATQPRLAPHIFTDQEIGDLMDAARRLAPVLRGATAETVIGLLAATGLRIGEALALDRAHVDLDDGVILVNAGKSEQREVLLHDTTVQALDRYAMLRDRILPAPADPAAFFLATRGQRLPYSTFQSNFHLLLYHAGVRSRGQRSRPRAHDLRHTYAVNTLLQWHRDGHDIERSLPVLATALGHATPESTYWYAEAVPEVMTLVAKRLDGLFGEPA
jgi:integrase/recombinase XerD